MPRPVVLGNGFLLVNIDDRYRARDLFFPYVGIDNHIDGHFCRQGIWDGLHTDWFDSSIWSRQFSYINDRGVSVTKLYNHRNHLQITAYDEVPEYQPYHLKTLEIHTPRKHELTLFSYQDLRIAESDVGDTALFDPFEDCVIHFKRAHHFAFGGWCGTKGIDRYACGLKGVDGHHGTWLDAEDGKLSNNAIAQGSVDSTFSITIPPGDNPVLLHWFMVASNNLYDLREAVREVREKKISVSLSTAPTPDEETLGDAESRFHCMVMRTQIDRGGAIMAATDTDIMKTNRSHYSYCWPRDAVFVAQAFDAVEDWDIGHRYLEYAHRIQKGAGYPAPFFQKYCTDGTLGSTWHPWTNGHREQLPIQLDQTALTIGYLAEASIRENQSESNGYWQSFGRHLAEFLYEFREPETSLPNPSYDLWEERFGIHTFTTATVIYALTNVGKWLETRNPELSKRYSDAAEEVRLAMRNRLFNNERGAYFRMLSPETLEPDTIIDSSSLAVSLLGVEAPEFDQVVQNAKAVEETCTVRTAIGGVARNEDDYYARISHDVPGNPWIITTCWLARHKLLTPNAVGAIDYAQNTINWVRNHALETGILPEQIDPFTGESLTVAPLTWSHAEFVRLLTAYRLAREVT
ncbi:MAG: glycoside hydrolase family 15 protein [Fimbriimonadaceae bacterium]